MLKTSLVSFLLQLALNAGRKSFRSNCDVKVKLSGFKIFDLSLSSNQGSGRRWDSGLEIRELMVFK